MFCNTCGAQLDDTAQKCSQCGNNPHDESTQEIKTVHPEFEFLHAKSRIIAGLLQIFLGFVGAGRLYLGYYKLAILQFLLVIITGGSALIWPVIDGIMILSGHILTDSKGNPLS